MRHPVALDRHNVSLPSSSYHDKIGGRMCASSDASGAGNSCNTDAYPAPRHNAFASTSARTDSRTAHSNSGGMMPAEQPSTRSRVPVVQTFVRRWSECMDTEHSSSSSSSPVNLSTQPLVAGVPLHAQAGARARSSRLSDAPPVNKPLLPDTPRSNLPARDAATPTSTSCSSVASEASVTTLTLDSLAIAPADTGADAGASAKPAPPAHHSDGAGDRQGQRSAERRVLIPKLWHKGSTPRGTSGSTPLSVSWADEVSLSSPTANPKYADSESEAIARKQRQMAKVKLFLAERCMDQASANSPRAGGAAAEQSVEESLARSPPSYSDLHVQIMPIVDAKKSLLAAQASGNADAARLQCLNMGMSYKTMAVHIASQTPYRGISPVEAATGSARLGEEMLMQALTAARGVGDHRLVGYVLMQLASLSFLQGKEAKAVALLEQHLRLIEQTNRCSKCLECDRGDSRMVRCPKCGVASYCSLEHQRAAWRRLDGHVATCELYKNYFSAPNGTGAQESTRAILLAFLRQSVR